MSTEPEVLEQDPTIVAHSEPIVALSEPIVAHSEPVVAPTPVPPVEKRHSYQPTDEQGRALGGPQVIVYTTEQELVEKMTKNSIELIRKLRSITRDNRLGKFTKEELPSDADLLPPTVQFNEKPLTAEERYSISQDLNDPSKFDSARDRLLESAIGQTPQKLRDTLNQTQMTTMQLLARQNAQEWIGTHPEFYPCSENVNTICDWMVKNGLQPTVKNFEFAQTKITEAGLLLSSPIVREVPSTPAPVVEPVVETVPKPQAPVVEPTRISEVPPPQENRQARVPSGLNNRIAPVNAGTLTPSVTAALTLGDIDRMSSDDYRKNLSNSEFRKRVDELAATVPPRPRRQ
jgi:hypothetical protein